jgi:simple sugar transport system ATP-binding protein
VLEARELSKSYGSVQAVRGVSLQVYAGEVTCLLGDNGAGKSTLIEMLSGVTSPDSGLILIDSTPVALASPAQAVDRGIATVFQDLAIVPIMPVYRNFTLGREPTRGRWPLRRLDRAHAKRVTKEELDRFGIAIEDVTRPISTLSGGQRQCVAIARAIHFGARVLILDEPTSALGLREAEVVLNYIMRARAAGIGVVLITHNAHHAYPIGDRFVILRRGAVAGAYLKAELGAGELVRHMAGGEELARLEADLEALARRGDPAAPAQGAGAPAGDV